MMMDSGDEFDYNDDGDDYNYNDDSDDDDDDCYLEGDDDALECNLAEKVDELADDRMEKHYTCLSEADIRKRQEEAINTVTSIHSITTAEAGRLLVHYKWNATLVHDEWFADEEKIRNIVGLPRDPVVSHDKDEELTCGICFDDYPVNELLGALCGHLFCATCWEGYISTSINDGPGCLLLRCPEPSCCAAVCEDLVDQMVTDEDRKKFSRFFFRSYIENKKKTKWCPAPGCDHAVESDLDTKAYDVTCLCSYGFCWNCSEEAHRPVDCSTVAKWITKNSSESENTTWILANSKPCPKCHRPIEKNTGCMHMTCTPPCKFQFCWLCLGSWLKHDEGTGGFYSCNGYEVERKQGKYNESERIRERAKQAINKYTHYYERWASNESSRKKAWEDLRKAKTYKLKKLNYTYDIPETQLQFIVEALQQVIECRRVLKWTYAYGYYIPENEKVKKVFFEYSQGEAEAYLEKLHYCAENDLEIFVNGSQEKVNSYPSLVEFHALRSKLVGLTSVTKSYFEKLVRDLENGLSGVYAQELCATSKHPADGGKKKKGRRRPDSDSEEERWSCDRCIFSNPGSATHCQMCFDDN